MIIELFIAFLVILASIIVFSLIKHIFGFIFKIATILFIIILLCAGVLTLSLYQAGVFQNNFDIYLVQDNQVYAQYMGQKNESIYQTNLNISQKIVLDEIKRSEKTQFLIQTKNKNATKINERLQFLENYEKENRIKTYYSMYKIFSQKDIKHIEIYPKTWNTQFLELVLP